MICCLIIFLVYGSYSGNNIVYQHSNLNLCIVMPKADHLGWRWLNSFFIITKKLFHLYLNPKSQSTFFGPVPFCLKLGFLQISDQWQSDSNWDSYRFLTNGNPILTGDSYRFLTNGNPILTGILTDFWPMAICLIGQLNCNTNYFPCEKVHDRMHESLMYELKINCWGELPFLSSNNIVVLVVNTQWTTIGSLQKENLNP